MRSIIWVVGAPRSGTSFLTNYLGNYVDHCFNEPWEQYPLGQHNNWDLPSGLSVFKYCANSLYYEDINNKFFNSKWINIIRHPLHVLYSMVFPNDFSFPYRPWNNFEQDHETRVCNAFHCWSLLSSAPQYHSIPTVCYENIDLYRLSKFVDLPLDFSNFNFRNSNDQHDVRKLKWIHDCLNNYGLAQFIQEKIDRWSELKKRIDII